MLCAPQNRRFCPKPPASAPGDRLFCRYLPRKTLFFAPNSPGCTVFFPPRRGFPPGFPRQSRPNPRLFRPGFPAKHSVCAPASAVLPQSPRWLAAPVWFSPRLPASWSPPWLSAPALFAPVAAHGVLGKPRPESPAFFAPAVAPPKGTPNPRERSRKDRRPLSRKIPRN